MKRYQLSKAGVNVNDGIKRFGGDVEMYQSILMEFPGDKTFEQLQTALKSGDVEAAFTAAHSLKGVSGNLSMDRLYRDICPMVEVLRGGSTDGCDAYMETLTADMAAILTALS